MKAYTIIEISRTIQSGIKMALKEAMRGTDSNKEDYDFLVDHDSYIGIKERKTFLNEDENGDEYEDERWSYIIIVSLNRDTNLFEISKIWSRPDFDYWTDGGKKDWESIFIATLNHYLQSVKQYF